MTARERADQALNRLCKWRAVLVGRILGTRPIDDPPTRGFRDLFEKLLILRAETTALATLCVKAHLFTTDEFANQIADDAAALSKTYEQIFPGFKATDIGLDIDAQRAAETTKGWPA